MISLRDQGVDFAKYLQYFAFAKILYRNEEGNFMQRRRGEEAKRRRGEEAKRRRGEEAKRERRLSRSFSL
jgi:hypothetical protein